MSGSKLYGPSGNRHTPRRRLSRGAASRFLSPHPGPLPWGEGEPFAAGRTIQRGCFSTARSSLFPLPEGEGQGEGKRREVPSRVSVPSRNFRTQRVLGQRRRVPKMTL